jgi:hypothetical protein
MNLPSYVPCIECYFLFVHLLPPASRFVMPIPLLSVIVTRCCFTTSSLRVAELFAFLFDL